MFKNVLANLNNGEQDASKVKVWKIKYDIEDFYSKTEWSKWMELQASTLQWVLVRNPAK